VTLRVVGAVLYIGVGASVAAYFLWAGLERPADHGRLIYYTLPLFSGWRAWPCWANP
jgi:hypothetical protein